MRGPARFALALLLLAGACAPVPPPADRLVLKPARFADLPGWAADDHEAALAAFRRSCSRLDRLPDDRALDGFAFAGTGADWRPVCAAAAAVAGRDGARAFFEAHFLPVAAFNNDRAEGLFTGYFEPTLRGSRRPGGSYSIPLYRRPGDLVTVDLGLFRDSLKGQRIAGRVVEGSLRPYADRTAIERGALQGRGLELVWVDDAVDAFFLQVQGSGRVELDDGGVMRVGYAAQNGHPYTAIGRVLIERGALAREQVSMQTIRDWLAANPAEAGALMQANASYVFFRELDGEGPLGAQGVALTAGRSLAVDRAFLPLGLPIHVAASRPAAEPGGADVALNRLLVAQDTGGAIKGPVRGDVFWGPGREAAEIAGRMKHAGRYWLLLPRAVAARLSPSS
jgi:membrane-bound lytic murein transglycosylase A